MTGTAGAGELGSSCGPVTGPSFVGESGVRSGGPRDAGTAESGEAAVNPGRGDEGGDVGGCWCCCIGVDGLGRGGVGWSGGEGNRVEGVSVELESGLLSLSSSSSYRLFLAFLIGGGAVGDSVRTGGSGMVGQGCTDGGVRGGGQSPSSGCSWG
jgi:hypothetical protein